MGNDIQHQRADGGGEKYGTQRSYQRSEEHPRNAQLIGIGQCADEQHHNASQRVHAHDDHFTVAFIHNAARKGCKEHKGKHGNGGHNAHQRAGASLLVHPVANGNTVEQIADCTDCIALQHQNKIFIP